MVTILTFWTIEPISVKSGTTWIKAIQVNTLNVYEKLIPKILMRDFFIWNVLVSWIIKRQVIAFFFLNWNYKIVKFSVFSVFQKKNTENFTIL